MSDLNPAIAALERRLAEHERKGNELKSALNVLYEEAGMPAKYSETGAAGGSTAGGPVLTQIKRDSFYGKKQMTAIREYLEMRRGQGDGPAAPREILDALKAGGYQFEAKTDEIALVGLRALLRKATSVFHKLPAGNYGLAAWYPDAKSNDAGSSSKKRPARRVKRVKLLGKPSGGNATTILAKGDESDQ